MYILGNAIEWHQHFRECQGAPKIIFFYRLVYSKGVEKLIEYLELANYRIEMHRSH